MRITTLELFALVSAGMMTGNELCVSIFHAQIRRMEEKVEFEMGQASAAAFGKFMPFWYAATLLLTGAVAYSLRGSRAPALLADISAALWLLSIVLTVTLLVPINSRIAGWKWETRPADWPQARRTWDTRHAVRVCLLLAALLCLVFASLLPSA